MNDLHIVIEGDKAKLNGPFPFPVLKLISSLSGRKLWNGSKSVIFEATAANIRIVKESGFNARFEDRTGDLAELEEMENLATQHSLLPELKTDYVPRIAWVDHQKRTLRQSSSRRVFAHLHEMGLGKTAIVLAEAAMFYLARKVTGLLVVAPKGVHEQWITEQAPEHFAEDFVWDGQVWKQKEVPDKAMRCKGGLAIFTINSDAIRTERGKEHAKRFLKIHNGRSMMAVDESHKFKNWAAARTKALWEIGELAAYRRIMTGTLLSKNILDAWAQFKFLDVKILGHKYVTSFRSRYCIMGGFEGREVVGQRNVEEFYRLIAPHSFRTTKKEELDLPEKQYIQIPYEMGDETRRHYSAIKDTFMTELDNGSIVDVPNAIAMLVRLQQITCGYIPFTEDEDGPQKLHVISDERIEVLMNALEQLEGKVIIWARFIPDGDRIVKAIAKEYGDETVVRYRGSTKDKRAAKERFIESIDCRFFVSNQTTGGTGTDGLQKVCDTAIFYSNSFNAIDRWQSEDRIDRMGMIGGARYFDIVAAKSPDRHLLRNLKAKKSMSDLTLDQIRGAVLEM